MRSRGVISSWCAICSPTGSRGACDAAPVTHQPAATTTTAVASRNSPIAVTRRRNVAPLPATVPFGKVTPALGAALVKAFEARYRHLYGQLVPDGVIADVPP